MRLLLLFVFGWLFVPFVAAHEVRPAYLELRETSPGIYSVTWKVPGRGENLRLALDVDWPAGASTLDGVRRSTVNQAFIDRSQMRFDNGLAGKTIGVRGLDATMTDVLVRVEQLGGVAQVVRLTPAASSFVVEATAGPLAVAKTYGWLGIEHILMGVDHLLFVLALLLVIGTRWLVLLKTITAFTVSHSITLSLAALGIVHVPVRPVEAVIALSIVFVASEILRAQAGKHGIAARRPWIVAFVFGLLHGFGFASALSETGLPAHAIPLALLMFNAGVEIGQLLFVGAVMLLIIALRYSPVGIPARLKVLPPYLIGSVAMFWVIERLVAFGTTL